MSLTLEVLFTPAEFTLLPGRDMRDSVCVVFDILRATSTMMSALANGAQAIVPVLTIQEALARREPGWLLAGEREGLRITSKETGSVDFDLGNSPREFTPERVRGKTIVTTTTNGTRALVAAAGARYTFIGSFLNLEALARAVRSTGSTRVVLVCAGTGEEAAYEDSMAAGALCQGLWPEVTRANDAAQVALQIYEAGRDQLLESVSARATNARRLLGLAELREDVAWCLQKNTLDFAAAMVNGAVRRMPPTIPL